LPLLFAAFNITAFYHQNFYKKSNKNSMLNISWRLGIGVAIISTTAVIEPNL
jgi:hypothetical protein